KSKTARAAASLLNRSFDAPKKIVSFPAARGRRAEKGTHQRRVCAAKDSFARQTPRRWIPVPHLASQGSPRMTHGPNLHEIVAEIRACRICAAKLVDGVRPV